MTKPKIRVLVVDDSAFARKVIRELLSRDPEIDVVGIARDGLEALEKIAELQPDVITLDLLMPDLDGLGVMRALPKEKAPKVLIVSVSSADTDIAMEALQLGAVDIVSKPTPLPTDRLYDMSEELLGKVKIAAQSNSTILEGRSLSSVGLRVALADRPEIVVIGTSTGGPQALTRLFEGLPKDLPSALAIALHIPSGYTAALAERLTRLGGIPVDEAYDGFELKPGRAVIAAGGLHMKLRKVGNRILVETSTTPLNTAHHPSVDVLFESAAEHFGKSVLGVVLTGMGDDGTKGSAAIKQAGGRVLAESASSCVVYGMPRSVIEAGLSDAEASLKDMPEAIARIVGA